MEEAKSEADAIELKLYIELRKVQVTLSIVSVPQSLEGKYEILRKFLCVEHRRPQRLASQRRAKGG